MQILYYFMRAKLCEARETESRGVPYSEGLLSGPIAPSSSGSDQRRFVDGFISRALALPDASHTTISSRMETPFGDHGKFLRMRLRRPSRVRNHTQESVGNRGSNIFPHLFLRSTNASPIFSSSFSVRVRAKVAVTCDPSKYGTTEPMMAGQLSGPQKYLVMSTIST